MEQKEGPLIFTEIISSSEYELESEVSTGSSPLLLYISSPLTLPPPLSLYLPISSPP